MKRIAVLAAIALAVGGPAYPEGLVLRADRPVPGQYLVVFKSAPQGDLAGPGVEEANARARAQELALLHGAKVRKSFGFAVQGAVMQMSASQAASLSRDERVAFVEEDGYVDLAGTQTNPPSWGLDRIDQRNLPLDATFNYLVSGSGVRVYVVDTGIRSTHLDFAGRVDTQNWFSAIDDGYGGEDCNGHGTMVAGLIAGTTFGVAKLATLHSVRVLDCAGVGTVSNLVAGLDWVVARQTPAPKVRGKVPPPPPPPAVINLSLRSLGSAAIDAAVQSALTVGVAVVAAAGNDAGDACGYSPGRLPSVLTVAASNDADNLWVYSNGGACVKLVAPGVRVATTTRLSDGSWGYFTGTSAAAALVAGTLALFRSAAPATTPQEVQNQLVADTTAGVLGALPPLTPNRLLFSALAGADRPPLARFTFSCRSGRCSFDASGSSDDKGIVSYSWSFGDGTTGSGATVTHRFPAGSAFLVTLMVTDTSGQSATAQQSVNP